MNATPKSDEATKSAPHTAVVKKTGVLRVGLLGLGNVGQAVARLCAAARGQLRTRGVDLAVTGVLVRDAKRPREFAPNGSLLTDKPDEFFAQDYDIAIEVIGGVDPACEYVERCLSAGIPVVTANKALMAARGVELFRLAADHNTSLRCEASAIAGVPFLSALRDRPLIARVTRLSGILNGTSNYILSSMYADGVAFDQAVRDAQTKGFAEADPTLDVQGVDAAEKLVVILQHLGVTGVRVSNLELVGITDVEPIDFEQAKRFKSVLKSVASAQIGEDRVDAFVGPTLVKNAHPLATIEYERNAIRLQGPDIGDLVFAGPGAGREVTAATMLDDVVQIVTEGPGVRPPVVTLAANDKRVDAPATPWFVRAVANGTTDQEAARRQVVERLATAGVSVRQAETASSDGAVYVHVLTQTRSPEVIRVATDVLRSGGLNKVVAYRVLGD